MPRLRRKTPHEPVLAIPAPAERGPAALPRAGRSEALTLRAIALSLNNGQPRSKELDIEPPELEIAEVPAVAPFRERAESRTGQAELLVFRVGAELFATELRAVEEAVEGVEARPIPDAPPAMLGIFAFRDRTLPMYSFGRVLSLPVSSIGEMTLVLRPSSTRIALAVDAVDDVFEVELATVRPVPNADADGIVLGVVWRGTELVTLLDADVVVDACLAVTVPDSL